MAAKHRIAIVGGGFGGVYTAIELEKRLANNPSVEITLISHDNFFLFTPMLHEVAASDLDLTNHCESHPQVIAKGELHRRRNPNHRSR